MFLNLSTFWLTCFLFQYWPSALAKYRHFHVDNTDICNTGINLGPKLGLGETKTLNIGTGAAIFQLKSPSTSFQPEYRNKAKRCEIHIKAPENHGLMAFIEEMHLRKNSKEAHCVDHIQFGQEDIIPFMTFVKSERLCGEMSGGQNLVSNGFAYDDPRGDLLIWVTIGGRRETPSWPSISVVNLTLVVTTYQKDCQKPAPGFLRCASGRRCIWKHYFCDQHFNCPKDLIPADEDGCTYKEEGSEHTTLSPGSGGMNHDDSLNAVSLTLIIVASALVLLLTLILLVRYRRIRKCCASVSASTNSSCELPEQHQPRSLAELNRQRHMRETESNIYLPLTTFLDQPMQQESQQQHQVQHPQLPAYSQGDPHPHLQQERQQATMEVGRGLPPPEEPPPAYDDLFPAENHTQTLPEIRVLDRSSSSPARRSAEPDVVQRERGVDEMAERDNLREQGTSSDSDDNAGEATSAIAATTPAHTS